MRAFAAAALGLLLLTGPPAGAAADEAGVPTYHFDPARSGHAVFPGLTWARAAGLRQDAAFDGRVQGHVYAQPLYWHPPGAAHGLLIVASEDNTVAALDAASGGTVWRRSVGPAAARSALPCGDIDPLGITGTPAIDARSGTLYFDAMVAGGGRLRHLLFALALRDGSVRPGWPVDVAAGLRDRGMTFQPRLQNQRGALTLVGDRLFVPFGGHWGDCGDYHGWVVGVRVHRPAVFGAWKTWAGKGGIWAPGGLAFDGSAVFAATGNTDGAPQWSGGEAIIRLPPDLRWRPDPRDYFAPEDWRRLDADDADLGGSNPLPIDLPGAALLLALGKDGKAYLLDRGNLGGIGRPLAVAPVADGPIITAPAAWRAGSDMMVALQARASSWSGGGARAGLIALRISGGPHPAIRPGWSAPLDGQGAPIVTTSDGAADPIVWVVGAEGDGRLHGFRGDTGQAVFDGGRMEGLRHFATMLAAEGRLYVAGDGRVYAFGFAP